MSISSCFDFGVAAFHRTITFDDGVRYFPEGIEGYIYRFDQTPPAGFEQLIRYYDRDRDDWLLLLASETPPAGYDDSELVSGGDPDGTSLGWVMPNVDADGDGLVDAWEGLLGTDLNEADSDSDGCSDGLEILGFTNPTDSRLSDPLDGICLYDVLFIDGFESGDTGAWS